GSQLTVWPSTPPQNGHWHLFDVTYDGATARVYVDGQAQGSGALTVNTALPGSGLNVGTTLCCGMQYDDMAVYPAALSAASIDRHWTAGASPTATACAGRPASGYAQSILTSAPVAYYRLND